MSMYRGKIEAAKAEAEAFVGTCKEALARLDNEREQYNQHLARRDEGPLGQSPGDHSYGSPETGALRRKSMDLTRTLAELRK